MKINPSTKIAYAACSTTSGCEAQGRLRRVHLPLVPLLPCSVSALGPGGRRSSSPSTTNLAGSAGRSGAPLGDQSPRFQEGPSPGHSRAQLPPRFPGPPEVRSPRTVEALLGVPGTGPSSAPATAAAARDAATRQLSPGLQTPAHLARATPGTCAQLQEVCSSSRPQTRGPARCCNCLEFPARVQHVTTNISLLLPSVLFPVGPWHPQCSPEHAHVHPVSVGASLGVIPGSGIGGF
ncbi:uncharacterized protein LOC114673814 [Macaca mulatta]